MLEFIQGVLDVTFSTPQPQAAAWMLIGWGIHALSEWLWGAAR